MGLTQLEKKQRIKRRVRKTITGSTEKPRLSVYRSNKEIYAQIIDDSKGITMIFGSSKDKDFSFKGNPVETAFQVGKALAEKAIKAGIKTISFDRGSALYHGRVKSLAEGAREAGLDF